MSNQIRSLPPGVDSIDDDVIFGTMWIKVGTLKLIRTTNAAYNVLCQFWGETTPAILTTRFDTPNNQQQRTQKYNIKCPVTFFAEYLQQMKNNLRLEVQQVGKVSFDMMKFLKKNVSIDSKQAFQHFKGFFQVIGKGNRKAGSLQIQMGCSFDPQIALRELGQQGIKQIRKSQMMNCPAQKLQVKQCCGHCECVCGKSRFYKKKQQKKIEIKNDDPRIPHSLDVRPRDQNSFDANKYQAKQEQKPPRIIKKQSKKQQKQPQKNQSQQFPQVPKILTYSNLRLNYDDAEYKNAFQQSGQKNIMIQRKPSSKQSQNKLPMQIQKNKILPNIGQSVQDSHYEIKAKPLSNQQLIKQFYGAENSPFKSNYQSIKPQQKQKSNQNFYRGYEQSQKDKLSRVINLDKELDLIKIRPPPLLVATQSNPHSTNSQFPRNMMRKNPNKSNLMLSLFLQINKNSVSLPNKQPFIIAYRPYGQKQRLTLGSNFTQIINILSIVGENQVRKMGKTPFIIQFWSSAQNKFIGLIKIDLTKIKQGFLLQDSLNQIAIKTNILPTTIQRGTIKIIDLFDKQVGSCNIYAAIGTSTQLNTYLNQKQSNQNPIIIKPNQNKQNNIKIQDLQKQNKQINKMQHNIDIDSKNIIVNFDTFLQLLYKHNNNIIDSLNHLMNKKYIDRKQVNQLAKIIGINSLNNIFDLHRKITQQNKQNINFHQIAQSFDDYIEIVQIVRDQYQNSSKIIRNLYKDPNQILNKLKQQTPMQAISKRKAQQILQLFTKYHQPIIEYFNKFNQYINLDILTNTLLNNNNKINDLPDLSQFNKDYLNQIIAKRFFDIIGKQKIQVSQILNKIIGQNQKQTSVYRLWKEFKGKISLWILFHIIEGINKGKNQQGCQKIDIILLDKFIKQYSSKNAIQQKKNEQPKKQIIQPPKPNIQTNPKPIDNPQPLNQSQIKHPQQSQVINPNNFPEQNPQRIIQQIQNQQLKKQPTLIENYFKHLFSIQPIELTLDHPIKGNCIVVYEFPYDQQQVKSKNFITSIDKHKYPLKMYGTHGFTIQQDAQNYLNDNSIKFQVKIDKRIQYEGALPSDQLLIQPNTEQDKIIPLFSQRVQGIAGKLKLNINYQKALAIDNILGKQTTYQLFLPKSGYLNYTITCQLQPSKIRSQLNIRQQFYVALVLDTFYHNSNLRNQFPPFSSKLFSDSSENAQLNGSIKLSLSPVILQYLKSNTARLSLNIIYYSKQTGNFQRKQIPYAIIQLPLINVIKAQGIKGDYAFKNKLGMFVTLANCQLKYDKDALTKLPNRQQIDKHLTSYWLILNFLQFINFQTTKYNWIKMQFVLKGRKYSTQKLQLQQFSINFLHNASILIKFTQQQFIDTKIIPITIITNLSQKLAIDVNLKAIGKDLIHHKYSINNQNYIVVNQSSKASRIRLALKTYCFRGGPLLSNFVNSLYQHLDTQVFDQIDFPQQVQNYQQVLNIFKNNLKLTQKNLQQAMSQLDLTRNKQKLNFEFFTNRTYYKLDFTPILAQNQTDIDFICQQLPTQTTKNQLLQYLSDNKIKLQNFRQQFIDRYYFKQLNRIKADKNIEFLGLDNQVDLITFIRKIKLLDSQNHSNSQINNMSKLQQKVLDLTILQGTNFQQLYNGIKPNSIIRIPDIGLQTQVSHRNSSPYFNQHIQIELDRQNLLMLKNLKFQVYHCTVDDDDAQNILIAQGYININVMELRNNSSKIIKVVLSSVMSNRMKASLSIKIGVSDVIRSRRRDESSQNIQESADVSRFGEIMQDIRQQMAYKNKLFQSSDEDDT